ncbi:MAG: mannose-6-phosphate isomerase, class I [Lachnospiraceae bacterium]|nr:mannose-6-phosphate isomerase, class I [Lachnospiraceae bacterium]
MGKLEILKLKPVLMERIWGGSRLKNEWGYQSDKETGLGECWVVSCNAQADSEVTEGSYKGKRLSELWEEEPQLFGKKEGQFPLLVKLIDAKEDLSIQVHPDDRYAREHENCSGKRECWYILDCPEGAELIIGNRARDKEEFKSMVREGRWDELLNYVPIRKGDYIPIDPGTLHAITAGVLLLEVQENSDITYRVHDYNRLQNGVPRKLHIEQSLAVVKAPDVLRPEQILHTEDKGEGLTFLAQTPDFKTWTLRVETQQDITELAKDSFLIASVVEGSGEIDGLPVRKGENMILPAAYPSLIVKGSLRVNLAAPLYKKAGV